MTHDPRLIRLVARHFDDLQGLRHVLIAVMLSIVNAAWTWTGSEAATWGGGAIAIVFVLIAGPLVARIYRRLGRVSTSRKPPLFSPWLSAVAIVSMHIQQDVIPGPSVFWLGFAVYWFWLAVDGWPWRWYHVLTCFSAVHVAFGQIAMTRDAELAWMAPRLWVFVVALGATGLADHFLLVRTVRVNDDALEEAAS